MKILRAIAFLLLACALGLTACDKLKPPVPSADAAASAPAAGTAGASVNREH